MNTSFSTLLVALVSVVSFNAAHAQSASTSEAPARVIQVAVTHPEKAVMSHEVATMIKLSHQAQAQYRRTGSTQDLARVNAMRLALAERGFGRATQPAPALQADTQFAAPAAGAHMTLASAAQ